MGLPSVTNTFTPGGTIFSSQVNENFTDIIAALTDTTSDLSFSTLILASTVGSNLIPGTTSTFSLGSSSLVWANTYSTTFLGAASGVTYSFVGLTTTGIGYVATGRIRFTSAGTAVWDVLDSTGPLLVGRPASAGTSYIAQSINDASMNISGGSGSSAGANIHLYGGTHATQANDIDFKSGSTSRLLFDDSDGRWEFEDDVYLNAGSLVLNSLKLATGGSVGSNSMLKLNGNALTGGTQINVEASTFTVTSAGTTFAANFLAGATTAAASFTCPQLANFYSQNVTIGAGSTITRRYGYYVETPTGGTSNISIGDNTSATGAFFIHSNRAAPSSFGGPLCTVKGDVATTATINSLSSATGVVRLTGSTATTINGITAGIDGQHLTIHNVSSAAVTLSHESGSAGAAEQRITIASALAAIIPANGIARLTYDSGSARWISHYDEASGTFSLVFDLNAGFGGSSTTTTVKYKRVSKNITFSIYIAAMGAGPAGTQAYFESFDDTTFIPDIGAGFWEQIIPIYYNSTITTGKINIRNTGGAVIRIYRDISGSTNFAAASTLDCFTDISFRLP